MLVVMMSLFAMALAMDEYNDNCRIAEDLRIESCVELEAEDYEWDESDISCQPGRTCISRQPIMCISLPFKRGKEIAPSPRISDKQRLGLVRRYAPRKALACYNYAQT